VARYFEYARLKSYFKTHLRRPVADHHSKEANASIMQGLERLLEHCAAMAHPGQLKMLRAGLYYNFYYVL